MLGAPRRYTRAQVEERTGVSRERSERLWRALGFADVDDDHVVFTDADVEALELIDGFVRVGYIDSTIEAAERWPPRLAKSSARSSLSVSPMSSASRR